MPEEKRKAPYGFYVIWTLSLAGILIISIVFLYMGISGLNQSTGESILNIIMGIAGLGIAARVGYDMFRARMSFKEEAFEVLTELYCESCGEKMVREFREGDYVGKLSEDDRCPKCQRSPSIAAIYSRTPKGKEKRF
ncbi:MAG: hypothetical protein BA066_02845 [Candidatus Korarchaeota archaeon NZ13-K]|nr:MAG: hypothetical protein BA066_02845 [Candidatus Korarchaeota archaeon NZ13-K]